MSIIHIFMKSHPMVMKTLVENSVKYANIHNDLPETQNINVLGCCPACMCAYLCRGILLSCPKSKPGRVKISAIHSSKILNGMSLCWMGSFLDSSSPAMRYPRGISLISLPLTQSLFAHDLHLGCYFHMSVFHYSRPGTKVQLLLQD